MGFDTNQEERRWINRWIMIIISLIFLSIGGCMAGGPQYRVYRQTMEGRAELARAESSRRIAVAEALAKKDSAIHEAAAERIRAQGVADANKIVQSGLGGPEGYLRYLAIDAMKAQSSGQNATTIYVATEAGIPITEASRFNQPAAKQAE